MVGVMNLSSKASEDPVLKATQRVLELLSSRKKDLHRDAAVRWVDELSNDVRKWNSSLTEILESYPGLKGSKDYKGYSKFLKKLLKYRSGLDNNVGNVEGKICANVKITLNRFEKDFDWLMQENMEEYNALLKLVNDARKTCCQPGVIGAARILINNLLGEKSSFKKLPIGQRIKEKNFINWHISKTKSMSKIINKYKNDSIKMIRELSNISENAKTNHASADFINKSYQTSDIAATIPALLTVEQELRRTPQKDGKHIYTILAFAFGIAFITSILVLAVYIPNPTEYQKRVFITVLSIAVAGGATVMTGLLDVRATLGKQLLIGATGALATFVIVYLIKPGGL